MLLDELKKGQAAVIDDILGEEEALKLLEMGCLPGEKVEMSSWAPFGGPLAIKVGNYMLSLRRSEARRVRIKMVA